MPMLLRSGGIRCILSLALAWTLAGCSSSSAPAPPGAVTYALVSIDGVSLPTFDASQPQASTVGGSVVLVGNDSAEVRQTLLTTAANGNPPVIVVQLGYYSVTRSSTTIVLQPHTLGVGADTATLTGTQLMVRRHVAGSPAAEQLLYVAQ